MQMRARGSNPSKAVAQYYQIVEYLGSSGPAHSLRSSLPHYLIGCNMGGDKCLAYRINDET